MSSTDSLDSLQQIALRQRDAAEGAQAAPVAARRAPSFFELLGEESEEEDFLASDGEDKEEEEEQEEEEEEEEQEEEEEEDLFLTAWEQEREQEEEERRSGSFIKNLTTPHTGWWGKLLLTFGVLLACKKTLLKQNWSGTEITLSVIREGQRGPKNPS